MNVSYDGDSPDARMALKTKRLGTEDIDEVVVHLSGNNRRLLAQFLTQGDSDEGDNDGNGPPYQRVGWE